MRGTDANQAEFNVSGITYNGDPLAEAESMFDADIPAGLEIWFLESPNGAGTDVIQVTHSGKVSDSSSSAISFEGTDTLAPLDDTDIVIENNVGSITTTINPADTDSVQVGCAIVDTTLLTEVSVSVGTQIDEVDEGTAISSSAWVMEGGGSATITWAFTVIEDAYAISATFKEDGAAPPPEPPSPLMMMGVG